MSEVTPAEVRLKLKKSNTTDDAKIQSMIDAAEAAYARHVGPLPGDVTEVHHGGGTSLILGSANVSAITEAAYSDGTAIDVDDLSLDTATGIVYWGYGTPGVFTAGTRNVTVTYTAGELAADHREAIIADVAGYYVATQRGGDIRADFPGEGYADALLAAPLTLWPRIQALAVPSVA